MNIICNTLRFMKNLTKITSQIALLSLLSLSVTACSDNGGSGVVMEPASPESEPAGEAVAATGDYEAGVNAAFEGNYDIAFREFSIAAEEGLHLAQYNLAILYFFGQGVEKDIDQAFKWTEAAANQGHVAAQFNLGSLYYTGDGTSVDRDKAVELYESAANAGHGEAAFVLATMYDEADHVDGDPVQAHAWANLAISNDHGEASELIDSLEQEMTEQQLGEARRIFARWQIQ